MVLTAPRSAERVFGLSPNARNVPNFFSKPELARISHEANVPRIERRTDSISWNRIL